MSNKSSNPAHDAILDCIFDPNLSYNSMFGIVKGPTINKITPTTTTATTSNNTTNSNPNPNPNTNTNTNTNTKTSAPALPVELSPNDLQAIELEKRAIDDTEKSLKLDQTTHGLQKEQLLQQAKARLENAITLAPKRASLYNNLAQVLRLLESVLKLNDPTVNFTNQIFEKLNTSIELSTSSCATTATDLNNAKQAYTQRAIMHQLLGDLETAQLDHEKAAELGSDFSKKELVNINPYAAMCNAMLSEVMAKLSDPQKE